MELRGRRKDSVGRGSVCQCVPFEWVSSFDDDRLSRLPDNLSDLDSAGLMYEEHFGSPTLLCSSFGRHRGRDHKKAITVARLTRGKSMDMKYNEHGKTTTTYDLFLLTRVCRTLRHLVT